MARPSEAPLGYVPHFDVTTVGGQRVRYQDLWQHRNLVLLLVSPGDRGAAARFAAQVDARRSEFEESDAAVVITADPVSGFSSPRLVIADRWGEILHVEGPAAGDGSWCPGVDSALSWVRFAQIQCPECPP